MPFWSSTCHSDSKEYFLLFASKRFKINVLHNWEYKIFEILLWLKPSWNHGVSKVLQKAEAETNGMRQWPHVVGPLALLMSIETGVWHYCELVPQPACSADYKTASNLSVATVGLVLSLLPLWYLLCGMFSKSNHTTSQLSLVELKLLKLSQTRLGVPVLLGMPSLHVPCFEFKILTWISTTMV